MQVDYATLTPEQLANMSDEDFAKLDPSKFGQAASPIAEQEAQPQGTVETTPESTPVEEPAVQVEEPQQPTPVAEVPNEAVPNGTNAEGNEFQAGTEPNVGTEGKPSEEKPTEPTQPTAEVNKSSEVQAFYDKVTAEFTASGKQFQVQTAEDVISLMQKGVDYNNKMATIKPTLKIVKALADVGIDSVEQLGYLIDLHQKKPEAIAKLVQESGIDTYDLNEEKAAAYVPSTPDVTDARINFEMAAQALESNPHFGTVVNHLKTFDDVTKNEIYNNPHLLGLLTDHVQNGFYDKIVNRLTQEQALGRLQGIPFIRAYDMVGNMLFGQGQQQNQQVTAPAATPVIAPTPVPVPVAIKPKADNNPARQAAAAPSATTVATQSTLTIDDLYKMSDADFAKIDPKSLKIG